VAKLQWFISREGYSSWTKTVLLENGFGHIKGGKC
jgi:hypothetical protein